MSRQISRSLTRQFMLALPLVEPMRVLICAARKSSSSSSSEGVKESVPPARIWLPARPATPGLIIARLVYSPVRMKIAMLMSGNE